MSRSRALIVPLAVLALVVATTVPAHDRGLPGRTPAAARAESAAAGPATARAVAAEAIPLGVPEKVASVEGINEYRLDNGLRVLLFPDPSKQTATVNITYLVGSRHEGYGETGMAHLLEHMVFKGTPKHPDIPQELTAHGCRPNGTTWFDRTNYFETFDASDENLEWALDLEADRMVNSFISGEDLQSEFTVVRNEFEMGENSPQGVLIDRIMSAAYLWHGYGRSTIGSRSDIEKVPVENLRAFYRRWYQPDNAILVVAGKFDEARALALVQEKFGSIPKPERALPQTWTVEPAQDGERTVSLRRVGDAQMVGAGYHVCAGSHPDFAAVEVLTSVLGDTPSGRLHEALVETKKAASVFGWSFQLAEPGMVLFGADVRKDAKLAPARDELVAVIEGLGSKPATKDEVERAKARLLSQWEQSMRNSQWAAVGLSEWAAMGDWRLIFIHRDRLEAVTPADVQRVAATYLRRENRTLGTYEPTDEPARAEIPETPDVAALVADYAGREAMATGEVLDVTPAALEARVVRAELPSGMDLVLLPRGTRGQVVNVSLQLHFGDERSLRGRSTAGDMAGSMLMRGTAKRTRQEIQDELDRLRASLWLGGGATGAWGSLEVPRENLEAALRLMAEILRTPSFPADEYGILVEERLVSLEDSRRDPRQLANVAWQRHATPWPADDPRYTATVDEEIERVKAGRLDDAKRFHADFYGASAGELAVVGDFDPAQLEALAGELFGDWKARLPFERLSSPYRERPALAERIEAKDKESAVFRAGLPIALRDDDPDHPAMVLASFMTGGGFLNSRLASRLRQQDGLCYGVNAYYFADDEDRSAWFNASAIYAPQNSGRLVAGFDEEIAKILTSGFRPEEIAEAKAGWLQSRRVSRGNDRELARSLASRQFQGRTLLWDGELEAKVAALEPAEIHRAFREHVNPARFIKVQAGDFAKAEAEAQAPVPVN